jgi:hypothetical protein
VTDGAIVKIQAIPICARVEELDVAIVVGAEQPHANGHNTVLMAWS